MSMEQQQWSEWIEWKGGECPIPGVREWRYRFSDGLEGTARHEPAESCIWNHRGGRGDIVAYRVRLTAQNPVPESFRGIVTFVRRNGVWVEDTTESDRDIDIGDGVDENAAMLARDSAGMVKAVEPVPSFELQIEPEEAPGLLVVAPLERLGATRWGV
jgi:hypothetical protein